MKLKFIGYVVLILLSTSACNKKLYPIKEEHSETTCEPKESKFECIFTVLDLSEDASRISTKNDELILLVYNDTLNKQSADLIFSDYFIVDSLNESKKFTLYDSLLNKSTFIFVLVEMDTHVPLEQMEAVVSSNLENIYLAKLIGDVKVLTSLFGDDDLLGITKVSTSDVYESPVLMRFKGVHLFDAYDYQIEIVATPQKHKQ